MSSEELVSIRPRRRALLRIAVSGMSSVLIEPLLRVRGCRSNLRCTLTLGRAAGSAPCSSGGRPPCQRDRVRTAQVRLPQDVVLFGGQLCLPVAWKASMSCSRVEDLAGELALEVQLACIVDAVAEEHGARGAPRSRRM